MTYNERFIHEFERKPVTISLILINIIFFAVITILNLFSSVDYFFEFSNNQFYIKYFDEYWRIITSMFTHWTVFHLILNMLALYSIGGFLESYLKSKKYALIYFTAGILASIVTYFLEPIDVFTAGASGAIYGLMSAIFILTFIRPYDFSPETIRQIRLIMLVNLLLTFVVPNVSVTGHLGGALGGLLIFVLVKKQSSDQNIF